MVKLPADADVDAVADVPICAQWDALLSVKYLRVTCANSLAWEKMPFPHFPGTATSATLFSVISGLLPVAAREREGLVVVLSLGKKGI